MLEQKSYWRRHDAQRDAPCVVCIRHGSTTPRTSLVRMRRTCYRACKIGIIILMLTPSDGCGHYCLLYVLIITTTCLHIIIIVFIHKNTGTVIYVYNDCTGMTDDGRHTSPRIQLEITSRW